MFTSSGFQQFQSNPDNQEIINLQQNCASLEKRIDELQKCTSGSDVAVKIESIQGTINSLQHQMDNAAKSERQEVKAVSEKFNQLKALVVESREALLQRINNVDKLVQANTNHDNMIACLVHLDNHRCKLAADIADAMTTENVIQVINDHCSSDNKHKEDRKEVLSEFINYMKDSKRRDLFKSLLDSMDASKCNFKGIAL